MVFLSSLRDLIRFYLLIGIKFKPYLAKYVNQKQLPREVFHKNFTKFTQKRLCLIKVAGLRLATLFKKRLRQTYVPVSFAKLLRAAFYRTALVASSGELIRIIHQQNQFVLSIICYYL